MQVSFVSGIGCVANANITEVILLSRRPGGSNLNYVWMDDYDDKILKVSCYGLIIKNMVTLDQAYSLIKKVKVNYLNLMVMNLTQV